MFWLRVESIGECAGPHAIELIKMKLGATDKTIMFVRRSLIRNSLLYENVYFGKVNLDA